MSENKKFLITIPVNKQDLMDWLNEPEPIERLKELADVYVQALVSGMAKLNPGATVMVELDEVYDHKICVDGITDWESEYDLLQKLELDYQSVVAKLAHWDWLPDWAK